MFSGNHSKIFTPFSFLRINSKDLFWYQWIYPTSIVLLLSLFHYLVGERFIEYDGVMIVSEANSLLSALIGFYIAALAAVSSINSNALDEVIKGRPLTLRNSRRNGNEGEQLTRRRFLAVLFGYCASLSIFIYIWGVGYSHFSTKEYSSDFVESFVNLIEKLFWFSYIWAISSFLIVTLLGLHYLVDRMHRP